MSDVEIARRRETCRAFEIILSRVPMWDGMKSDLMRMLANERASVEALEKAKSHE